MAERAYIMHVKYTNASGKDDRKFVVIADGPSDAMRYLVDADTIGEGMSTINLTETDMTVVIPSYTYAAYNGSGLPIVIAPN